MAILVSSQENLADGFPGVSLQIVSDEGFFHCCPDCAVIAEILSKSSVPISKNPCPTTSFFTIIWSNHFTVSGLFRVSGSENASIEAISLVYGYHSCLSFMVRCFRLINQCHLHQIQPL